MENITIGYVVSAIGIIGVLIGAVAKVVKPVINLDKRIEGIETDRESDYERLNKLENDTKEIMLSINVMLSHFVDGNNTAKLKERKAQMDEYLIKR